MTLDAAVPRTNQRVVNLTPHAVVVAGPRGTVELASEGVARVVDHVSPGPPVGPLELVDVEFGEVEGLPDPSPGVLLLVSRVVALACPERADLVFPFGEVRDADGRITAVRALARIAGGPAAEAAR